MNKLTVDYIETFEKKLNLVFTYDGKIILSDDLFKKILFQNFSDKILRKKIQKYIEKNTDTPEKIIQSFFDVFLITRGYGYYRIYNALQAEYNPIHNYDRTEEITRVATNTSDTNTTTNDNSNTTHDGKNENLETKNNNLNFDSEKNTKNNDTRETNVNTDMSTKNTETLDTTQTTNQTDTNSVAAYNSPQVFSPKEQTERQGSVTNVGTNTTETTQQGDVTSNDTDNFTGNEKNTTMQRENGYTNTNSNFSVNHENKRNVVTDSNINEKRNETDSIRAFGNIGVTTNQQMIGSEVDLRVYNIYKSIVEEFSSLIAYYSYGA